jgi:carboxyl-terminal processing protease
MRKRGVSSRWLALSPIAGVLACLALLAACTAERPLPADPTARLFARGLDEITDLYIEPVSSRALVLSGAARLVRLDPKFSVTEAASGAEKTALVLSYAGQQVGVYPTPLHDDPHQWGAIIGQLIGDARKASPRVAAMSEEQIDKVVFDGITGSLDHFSRYSPPEAARDQRAARDGFGGIGVTLDMSKDELRITAVTSHGPADRAGLRAGDKIVAIAGVSTGGRSQADVIHELRGPILSMVEVTVLRGPSGERRIFKVQRELIVVPTVTLSRDGTIAVLHVASFNQSTTQRLTESIAQAQRAAGGRLSGIVLDLRGNPGGLLDQAVSLANVFISQGTIASTIGRNPASHQFFAATGDSSEPRVPVAVLINGGSASASEIVAAALQDAGRAVVVGSSSYGKGTVQTVVHLPNDGELTLTWARLITPSGYFLAEHGVVPSLCTSDLGDDDRAVQQALQRAGAGGAVRAPRASLDERAWSVLRNSCPARQGDRDIDVKIAERLLADPTLYGQAIHAIAQSATPARPPQAAAADHGLTAIGGALSSEQRLP